MAGETFTNLASITIKVDKKKIDAYEGNLEEVVVETVFNLPAMATIRLQDPQLKLVDDSLFEVGKAVEIEMTPPTDFATEAGVVFMGEIVALEPSFSATGAHTLVIRAYDKAHRLFLNRRTRTFENMTDADIASKVVKAGGLDVQADTTSIKYAYVLQYNQTDMEFLSERARRLGYLFFVQDGKAHFVKPSTRQPGPTLTLADALRSFRPRLSAAQQPQTYTTRGWDPIKKEVIAGKYDSSKPLWVVNGTKKSGGQVATGAFGSAETVSVEASLVDVKHAQTMAEADAQAREGSFVEGDGVAYLAPKLQAGVEVDLKGLGNRFSGKYFVTAATHYYNAQGGETHFSVTGRYPHTITDLIRPAKSNGGESGRINGVVVGVVTNVKDDQGLLRVRVKFPWMPPDNGTEIESNWAKLSAPFAGSGRGFAYLPEVNDEVLVAFEHGDVNRPYIVGTLWNSKDKPPEDAQQVFLDGEGVIRRIIRTRTGHTIVFDDSEKASSILIRDKTEQQEVFIDSVKNTIDMRAQGDIRIESGANITLKARQSINMEAQTDIIGKANAKIDFQATAQYNAKGAAVAIKGDASASLEGATLDLKGTGAANLQASGVTTIKGGMIMIN